MKPIVSRASRRSVQAASFASMNWERILLSPETNRNRSLVVAAGGYPNDVTERAHRSIVIVCHAAQRFQLGLRQGNGDRGSRSFRDAYRSIGGGCRFAHASF